LAASQAQELIYKEDLTPKAKELATRSRAAASCRRMVRSSRCRGPRDVHRADSVRGDAGVREGCAEESRRLQAVVRLVGDTLAGARWVQRRKRNGAPIGAPFVGTQRAKRACSPPRRQLESPHGALRRPLERVRDVGFHDRVTHQVEAERETRAEDRNAVGAWVEGLLLGQTER